MARLRNEISRLGPCHTTHEPNRSQTLVQASSLKLHPGQRQPRKYSCYVDDFLRLGLSYSKAKNAWSFLAARELSRRHTKLIPFHFSGSTCQPFTILDVPELPSKETQSYHGAKEISAVQPTITKSAVAKASVSFSGGASVSSPKRALRSG